MQLFLRCWFGVFGSNYDGVELRRKWSIRKISRKLFRYWFFNIKKRLKPKNLRIKSRWNEIPWFFFASIQQMFTGFWSTTRRFFLTFLMIETIWSQSSLVLVTSMSTEENCSRKIPLAWHNKDNSTFLMFDWKDSLWRILNGN